ncbi:MAG: O-antigen ligase family protein [Thermodesulfovibrionia bacterium]|nr:O-antigen ligase family protein [Thermodesulfovibrionia bacterium]
MKKYTFLLCIVLFILPFHKSFFSVEIGIITFNPYSLGIIALLGIALGQHIFSSTDRKYNFNLVDIFVIFFCLTFLVSTYLSKDLLRSGHMAFKSIFLPVVSYFVVKTFIESKTEYIKVLFSLLAGIILFSILGLLLSGLTHQRQLILSQNPIGAATLVIVPIVTILYAKWWKNKVGLVSLIFCLLLLIITYSRIYYFAILISPILFLLIRKGHIFKLLLIFFPISLILALSLSVDPQLFRYKHIPQKELQTITRVFNIELYKKSFYHRAKQYNEGLKEFKKHPVLGSGIKRGRYNVTVHNFHIEWLEYGGIIGYLLSIGIFLSYFISHRELVIKDRLSATHFCLICIILMNCFTNGIMHGIMPYMIFILLGLAEARKKVLGYDETDGSKQSHTVLSRALP